jgi:putative Holliday junction resolvase
MAEDAPQRMLGIDFGERRIGIAVSEGRVAVPLTIIEHTTRAADIGRIAALAAERAVTKIVVGLPRLPSGDEGEQARLTRAFARDLQQAVMAPVEFTDETLSSADAAVAAQRAGRGAQTRGARDDLAAAVILQRYIDARANAPR